MSIPESPTEIEDILDRFRKQCVNKKGGVGFEQTLHDLQARESRLIQKHIAMLQHVERLRHAVNVGHWNSTCGNCHQNLLAKDEPKNCPRCNFALGYFTTDYPDEVEAARKVFPYLEYFPKYDLTEWEFATLSKERATK
jgi:hypothetical protein